MRCINSYITFRRGLPLLVVFMLSLIESPAMRGETRDGVMSESEDERNLITKVLDYFEESNKPKPQKRFDFSVIGGPHYSSDTKLGLGIVAAGLYRHDSDSLTPESNVSLYGDVSTSGFYMLGIRGSDIGKRDKYRLDYNIYFYRFPTKFWGIGYDNGANSNNETSYTQLWGSVNTSWLCRVANSLYMGPSGAYTHVEGKKINDADLWQGEPTSINTLGLGGMVRYDTRDNLTAPECGWMISAEGQYYPSWMGNKFKFLSTKLQAAHYMSVWHGGVLAMMAEAHMTFGDVPWPMLATFGGSYTMRGYYEGRYRDKCSGDLTIELRQRVWHRIGMAVWVGAATIAPKISKVRMRHILPNAGVGYRWEFKSHTNVRLDYGIGRGESAIIFSINEAF